MPRTAPQTTLASDSIPASRQDRAAPTPESAFTIRAGATDSGVPAEPRDLIPPGAKCLGCPAEGHYAALTCAKVRVPYCSKCFTRHALRQMRCGPRCHTPTTMAGRTIATDRVF